MFQAIQAAGSVGYKKVWAAASAMDLPLGSKANEFGVKFDGKVQNTRANPVVEQWQNGAPVTAFPEDAVLANVKPVDLARK